MSLLPSTRSLPPLLLLFCLFASAAQAQWWGPNGVALSMGPGGEFGAVTVSDGAGGAIVAWIDTRAGIPAGRSDLRPVRSDLAHRSGHMVECCALSSTGIREHGSLMDNSYDVYAQRVTAAGQVAWAPNGVPVCNDPAYQDQMDMIADGEGGAYVAWLDWRDHATSGGDIYVQRLASSGSVAPGWVANGMAVCTATGDQWWPKLALDGAGGAFVTWEDHRREPSSQGYVADVYAQRVATNGAIAPGWPTNGLPVSTDPLVYRSCLNILPDGVGGVFIAWCDARNRPGEFTDLYAQRITAEGTVATGWDPAAVPICTAEGYQSIALPYNAGSGLVSDGVGGFIAAWWDTRDTPPGAQPDDYSDIYAQRVTALGAIAAGWPVDGLPVCKAADMQKDPQIVSDGTGGVIVVWEDDRNYFPNAWDVYAQRILATGEIAPGWPVDGAPVAESQGFEIRPSAASDMAGGVMVAYTTYESGEYHVYAQHMTAFGTVAPTWGPGGARLSALAEVQDSPDAVSDGAGGMIVAWYESRNDGTYYNIYGQLVHDDFPTPTLASLVSAAAEPGQVTLRWFAEAVSAQSALVYRRGEGSQWVSLGAPRDVGDALLEYEDRTVTEGRYAYRLGYPGDGGQVFTAEVWVSVPARHVLGLAGFSPNPARGSPVVRFSLGGAEPARLEVHDVSGRMVFAKDVTALGPGWHTVDLRRELRVSPGFYWLRLTQQDRVLTAKGLVLR